MRGFVITRGDTFGKISREYTTEAGVPMVGLRFMEWPALDKDTIVIVESYRLPRIVLGRLVVAINISDPVNNR